MNKLLISVSFFIICFVSGCGTTPTNKARLASLFTGVGLEKSSSSELRDALTQIGYMAGGQYEVQLTPITTPLIVAESNELAAARGFTPEQLQTVISHEQESYQGRNFCIDFQVSIVRFKEVIELSSWRMEVIDEQGTSYPLNWVGGLKGSPIETLFNGLYGPEKKWFNQGRACANNVFSDLSKGFHIKLTPSYVQWPFPASSQLAWGMDQNDNYQGYRGY